MSFVMRYRYMTPSHYLKSVDAVICGTRQGFDGVQKRDHRVAIQAMLQLIAFFCTDGPKNACPKNDIQCKCGQSSSCVAVSTTTTQKIGRQHERVC